MIGLSHERRILLSNHNHSHSQTAAILSHIAEKTNLAGETAKDRAIVRMLAEKATGLRVGLMTICNDNDFENLKEAYLMSLDAKIKFWSNYLGMRLFLRTWFANNPTQRVFANSRFSFAHSFRQPKTSICSATA